MKRVIIVDNQVPFVHGGAEYHINNLKRAIRENGYQVDVVRIPFKWYPIENIPKHILMNRLIDLIEANGRPVDVLIAFRFPSYYIEHPNKVVWLMSTYKSAYEFWNTEFCDLPNTVEGRKVKQIIHACDRDYLSQVRKLYTNSKHVASWFEEQTGIKGVPLYHPPPDYDKFHFKNYENFLFFPSRLTPYKRHKIAIEAMKYVDRGLKLLITGESDNPDYLKELQSFAESLGLSDKVIFLGRVERETILDLYSRCLAVIFPTYKEDYGYITLEGMLSKKPVITCKDSGGPTEFVTNEVTGIICEPEAKSLADAINRLYKDRALAMKLGENAKNYVQSLNLSWDNVVERLLE